MTSTILRNKKIFNHSIKADPLMRKGLRKGTYVDVEDALLKWFVEAQSWNVFVSGPLTLSEGRDFEFLFNFLNFSLRNGWLHHFKLCRRIMPRAVVSEAASVNDDNIDVWLCHNFPTIAG